LKAANIKILKISFSPILLHIFNYRLNKHMQN